jgi:hypothetical protein
MMQVCLLSESDSAGQNFLLAKAMRDHLGFDAKSFTVNATYLNYQTDQFLTGDTTDLAEYASSADLLIFQDRLFEIPGAKLKKVANQGNTIIWGHGTPMRNNMLGTIDYIKAGWHVLPPLSDPSLAAYIGGAPFVAKIVDQYAFDIPTGKRFDKLHVVHAPTKGIKGEEHFAKIVDTIKDLVEFEWMVIKKLPWKETLELKAKSHITLDSIVPDQGYGLNCLEGMALGHIVMSNISSWCYCIDENLPIHNIRDCSPELVGAVLMQYIKNYDETVERREFARGWVEQRFSPIAQASKWSHYIDWCGLGE